MKQAKQAPQSNNLSTKKKIKKPKNKLQPWIKSKLSTNKLKINSPLTIRISKCKKKY